MTWKSITTLAFILSTMMTADALAASLSGVTSKRIGSDFFIELGFNGNIADQDVHLSFNGDGIEVTVDGVAPLKKHVKAVKDASVESIATMTGPGRSLKVQLALAKNFNSSQFEKNTSFVTQTNQLLIRVGDPSPVVATTTGPAAEPAGDLIDKLMKQETPALPAQGVQVASARVNDETAPVFTTAKTDAKEKGTSTASLVGRMFLSLIVVITLFGGGIYALKKWPGAKKLTSRSRMIEILAQHALGPKKSVAVIRVAGETVLVGVTDNHISILKTLALLDEEKFQSALQNTLSKDVKTENQEDFSMRGLKEIVNDRLKNMRNMN